MMAGGRRRDVVVVGADGVLGGLLVRRLEGARGVSLRHPGALLDGHVPEVAEAAVVIDVSGPRVRPELGWCDYLREHVGTSGEIARSMRPGAHLVHVSSASVYGARPGVLSAEAAEAPVLFPNPSYAWAKLAGELSARAIARERGVRLSVLRFPVVYGPGVDSAIDTLVKVARRGVLLHLEPAFLRQHLLHSELLVRAIERVAERGPLARGLAIVADPFVLRNADLTAAVERRFRPKVRVGVPLGMTTRLLRGWPGFPERDAPKKLAAFGVLGLNTAFEWKPAFDELGLDAEEFAKAKTFDAYVDGAA